MSQWILPSSILLCLDCLSSHACHRKVNMVVKIVESSIQIPSNTEICPQFTHLNCVVVTIVYKQDALSFDISLFYPGWFQVSCICMTDLCKETSSILLGAPDTRGKNNIYFYSQSFHGNINVWHASSPLTERTCHSGLSSQAAVSQG